MDHNHSSNANMTSAHPQASSNDLSFNNYIDDLQAYADEPITTTNNDEYAPFEWNPNLFSNTEQGSTFQQQQPATASQLYAQDAARQSASPAVPHYTSSQPNFQTQFPQASFDPRHLSQTTYGNQFMSRVSPSPAPYSAYQLPNTMSYPNREQSLPSPQPYNMHPGALSQTLQQRPQPTANQSYTARQSPMPNPYFTYNVRGLPQYPGNQMREVSSLSGFQEQPNHQSNHFVNPSMLTANEMPNMMSGRSHDFTQPYPVRQQYNQSPVPPAPVVSNNDSQMQQNNQTVPYLGTPNVSTQTGAFLPPQLPKASKPKVPKDPNAPKKSRARPKKEGTMPLAKKDGQTSASSSESDSDELEIDEAPPEPKPPLLYVARPSDLISRALYDAVAAVWSPRNRLAVPESIRNGIKLFGEAVKALRDAWKVENESLRKAELPNSGVSPDATVSLKEKVAKLRTSMELLMQRTLAYGHPSHLKSLGGNPHTMSALYSFLLDRFNAGDYDGSLVISILKVVTQFTTLDQDMLEKTKNIKILEKLTKKAGENCKALAQVILDNAAAATAAKKAAPSSAGQNSGNPASPTPASDPASKSRNPDASIAAQAKEPVTGTKRPREGEPASVPAKRPLTKPIPQASKPLAVQAAERKRAEMAAAQAQAQAQAQTAKTEKPITNGVSQTQASAPKQKIQLVAPPKPTSSIFSALQSASKKPGTSNAARAAAATKEKPPQTTKRESPPPGSAPAKPTFSFMDTLADMSKPKEVEQKKVEDLPPETDTERAKRLRKEARRKLRVSWKPDDSLVETRTFTHDPDEEVGHADSMMRDLSDIGGEGRMLKLHMDTKAVEDEDDEGEDMEAYSKPSEIDFTDLDPEARKQNFIKMGGTMEPESASSQAQNRHEQNTLMVAYLVASDQPSSPKEPPQLVDEEDYHPEAAFGDPWQQTRDREAKYVSLRPQQHIPTNTATPDITAILQAMRPAQPAQQPPTGIPIDLQRTLSMLGQQQPQPQVPQTPQISTGGIDLNKLIAVATQFQAQQQPQFTPQPPQPSTQDLAALLARMTGAQQPPALPVGLQGNSSPFPGAESDYSRKHSRTDSNGNDVDGDYSKSKNKKKKGGEKSGTGGDAARPYNYKTMTCAFWQKGQCTKGDTCTYKHEA